MKFSTFYKTYYNHRIKKFNIFLKYFIFLILPSYLLNKILYPKPKNLRFLEKKTIIYLKRI